jgi:hypothetical protein
MREIDGLTVGVLNHIHKRRRDKLIEDQELRMACLHRIHDRVVPEIKKRPFSLRPPASSAT